MVQPEPERWLELALVIEVTTVYEVWRDTLNEFQHLLKHHGAFRDVRIWHLQPSPEGIPQLFLQTTAGRQGHARSPNELRDAGGRRLIMVLSDCTSTAWRNGTMPALVTELARTNPVVLGQLLPQRYWDRSALEHGTTVALRARRRGALNHEWHLVGQFAERRRKVLRAGLKLPVVTLEPASLESWAKAFATLGDQKTLGLVLSAWAPDPAEEPTAAVNGLTPTDRAKTLVQQFRRTASPEAQELADSMAVLPVSGSVIRLLQKSMYHPDHPNPQSGAVPLAEMVLIGLLRSGDKPRSYDFTDQVREVLLGTVPIAEALAVGESVAEAVFKQLPADVQQRVNADIDRRFGDALSYFEAFLIADLPWGEAAQAEILPFAQVTRQVLRRWGGDYAALADLLGNSERVSGDLAPFPDVQPFEFIEAHFEDDYTSSFPPPLQTDTFTIITLEAQAAPADGLEPFGFAIATLHRNRTQWQIERQPGSAYRFIERLPGPSNPSLLRGIGQRLGLQRNADTVDLEMVAIPGSTFSMGSPADERERGESEGPQHDVRVPPFCMGRYPVTQGQWRAVAALPQVEQELKPDPARFKGDNRPVEQVTWYDAVEFCARLSAHTSRQYCLPSEAEWEYACRAGTTTPFHFGETISSDLATYEGRNVYADGPAGEDAKATTPIDHFGLANAFGLSDMHGNVWEWCQDHWHSNYKGAPTDGSAWIKGEDSMRRIRRGGSWVSYPRNCRSAYRFSDEPDDRYFCNGFRVVCSAPRAL